MSDQRPTATKRAGTASKRAGSSTATPAVQKSAAKKETKAQVASSKGSSQAASSAKAKQKATEAKPHPLKRRAESVQRWYRETRAELSKVTWPDQQTTRNLTIVVIGVSIVLGLFLGGIDFILLKILEAI